MSETHRHTDPDTEAESGTKNKPDNGRSVSEQSEKWTVLADGGNPSDDGTNAEHDEDDIEETGIAWLGVLPAIVLGVEMVILLTSVYLGNNTLMTMGDNIDGILRVVYESVGLESLVSIFGAVITIAICVGLFNALCGLVIAGTKVERDKDESDLPEEENIGEGGIVDTLTTRIGYGWAALTDLFTGSGEEPDEPIAIDESEQQKEMANGGQATSSDGGTDVTQSNGGTTADQPETTESADSPSVPTTPETAEDTDNPSIRDRSAAYKLVSGWWSDEDSAVEDNIDINLDEKDDEMISRATERVQSRNEGMSVSALREEVATIEKEQQKGEVEGRTGAIDTPIERKEAERIAVAPEEIEESKTYLTRTGRDGQKKYSRTLIISNYPSRVAPGWLDELFTRGLQTNSASLRISYHINPRETSSMIDKLSIRVTRLLMGITEKKDKGKTNIHEEQQQLKQVKRLRNALSKGETKMYDFSLYMEVTADDMEWLNEGTEEVRNHFGRVAAQVTPLYDRQLEAQRSMAPLGTDSVKNSQIMDLDAMGTTFPFVDPSLVQPEGVLMGFHQQTSSPVVVNRFAQSGHNMLISGKIGSGKSYLAKLAMWRRLIIDPTVEILIIDPVGGFGSTVDAVGGQQITIGSDTTINPMEIREVDVEDAKDLESNPYDDKLRSLMGMFKSEFEGNRELTKSEEGVLRRAIRLAYLSKGITKEIDTHSNESPTIQVVLDILEEIAAGNHPSDFLDVPKEVQNLVDAYSGMSSSGEGGSRSLQDAADEVQMGLEMFRKGSARDNLNGNTNVELQDRIVQFDISNIADGSSETLYMHIILDWLFQRAKSNEGRTVVNIDEAHYMLGQEQALGMLNLFARHSRHYNSGLTLISQTVDEFMNTEQAKEIYDQCDIRALMRHEDLGTEATDALGLTKRDIGFVLQAQAGNSANYSECLLYATNGGKMRLNIKSNDFEHHVVEEDLNAHAYAYANGMISDDELTQERLRQVKTVIKDAQEQASVG